MDTLPEFPFSFIIFFPVQQGRWFPPPLLPLFLVFSGRVCYAEEAKLWFSMLSFREVKPLALF